MRRLLIVTALAVSAGALPAFAGDQDFKLVNRTGYQIDEVYVGPVSSNNWGSDVMGSDSLSDRESVNITFNDRNRHCHYDMMVKYNDGDSAQWHDLNLCQISKVTLFYNRRSGETRAVTD